jgi:hypothetical protein
MTQPGHRVRLGTHVLPTLKDLLESTAILSPTEHDDLTSSIFKRAKPRHVELAGITYPGRAVDGPVGPFTPPQSDVLLARGHPAAISQIEATK